MIRVFRVAAWCILVRLGASQTLARLATGVSRAMTKMLTDKFVAGARGTTRANYFDRKTRGLVLRVSPRAKAWYFTYRRGGPTQWLKLGAYPTMTLAQARTAALDQRHAIEVDGKDPAAERRQPPPEPEPIPRAFTFADFVPVFLAFQQGRTKTWTDDRAMIARYLTPAWGALPLKAITRTNVHEVLDSVTGKGLTVGVNRLQALISRIFTVALDRGLVDAHPAARMIKRFSETPSTRVLTDDELRALWRGLDAQPGPAADAIRLRLLLGQRGAETAGMRWSEVDLDAETWSMAGARTKNKRPHTIALPATALAIVKARRLAVSEDEARVFPDLSLASDDHRALGALHGGAFTWTDLRRTVATRLGQLGFDETTIGRVLNHARVTVTMKHYNQHAYLDEIRRALTAWDAELQRVLANAPKSQANILPMRARS
jgi:integrase